VKIDALEIPDDELEFTTSRSSGPGGQNVNKVSTRVTLLWDVQHSASLSDQEREAVRNRLGGRINRNGILRVVSQRHRTQSANREAALARFADLISEALTEAPERVPTDVPMLVNKRRLEDKRRRSRVKQTRTVDLSDED
jgi:ribosome-associated protein